MPKKIKPDPTIGIKSVYLLTTGDGEDGNEWYVESIHETHDGAVTAKGFYERTSYRPDGTTYHHEAKIEEWKLER